MKLWPLALLCLGACAGPAVVVVSDPPGATLIQRGAVLGRAPWPGKAPDRCQDFAPIEAVWPSGARASTGPLWICPTSGDIMIRRPDVPGRTIDENFALQREMGAMQAQAARDAAAAQMGVQLLTTPAYRPPVNCTSTRGVAGIVNTTCY